jgi:hypothetical protein
MLRRTYLAALIAISFFAAEACTKEQPPPPPVTTAAPPHRAAPSPVGTTQTVLQKTFNLKDSATFPFEIPADAVQPHLHGIFESFTGQAHGASDDSANIDFLVLNEEQQTAAENNRASEALFSVEASHNQAVNLDLPPSLNHPAKYYLVFRNPDGKNSKVVEANFRVDF